MLVIASAVIAAPAPAEAATGDLTQKAGTAGCISGSGAPCQDGNALDDATSVTVSPDGTSAYVAMAPLPTSPRSTAARWRSSTATRRPAP